jgi:hypothetical protein
MLLQPADAGRFIDTYQEVAVAIHGLLKRPLPEDPTHTLNHARQLISKDAGLLERAAAHLHRKGRTVDPEVIGALRRLRLGRWVHLKDLKRGAILLDLKGREVCSVVGLTQPLGSITGQPGSVIETALCPFLGRILCDGLIVHIAALGPELRRSCNERYRQLKASGRLHGDPATSSLWQEDGTLLR